MAAPKGNTNANGNNGGGRKSAYQELADALDAHSIFFYKNDQEQLEAKIRSGKFSLMDRLILTGMEGDTAILSKTLHKAVPDLLEHSGKDGAPIAVQIGREAAHYGRQTNTSILL
jgi:hypothetical protein